LKRLIGAVDELERASKEGKPMPLREFLREGWLAVVEATNILFFKRGLGPAESHRDRREKLWKLEAEDATLRALRIYPQSNHCDL